MRFIAQYGTPSLCISDGDKSFVALSRDKQGLQLSGEFANSQERMQLEREYGMRFKFNVGASFEKVW